MPKSKTEEVIKKMLSSFDGIASSYYILQRASDVNGFLTWLQKYHSISVTRPFFDGYKFLLGSIFKHFINEVYTSTSLELSEDEVLFRAQFKGIQLHEIPNTCEKTIIFKRIWVYGKTILKVKTWEDIKKTTLKMNNDLDVFKRLFEEYCKANSPFTKEYIVQAIACDYVFTYLNDTRRGTPLAEFVFPSIEQTTTEKYLSIVFPGYVYALQYLWYLILGAEEFDKTCVKDLHFALDVKKVKKYPREKSLFEELFEDNGKNGLFSHFMKVDESVFEENMKFIKGMKSKTKLHPETWKNLDRFYRPIQQQIVNPREVKLKANLGLSHFLFLDNYDKNLLNDLLDSNQVTQPDYLSKKDSKSIKKRLSLAMLWYDVNVLDGLTVFNGVPAFAPTLLGSMELTKMFRPNEPLKVIVFKHPIGIENQFNYSFAIFIQAYSNTAISDYSGWLIFFDCATDHSGFGGSLLSFAESVLHLADKNGPISIKEIVVNKEIFMEYLKEHSVSSVFDVLIKTTPLGKKELKSPTTLLAELEDFLAKTKGKLFEHIVHKWTTECKGLTNAICDTCVNGEQIDCIGKFECSLLFFECKLNLHKDTLSETIRQIKRKFFVLSETNPNVEAWLIVYGPVTAETKVAFENEGIFVQDNFRNILDKHPCFEATRKESLELLDWSFSASVKYK